MQLHEDVSAMIQLGTHPENAIRPVSQVTTIDSEAPKKSPHRWSSVCWLAGQWLWPQCRPLQKSIQCGTHGLSPPGQIVFDLRRHLWVHGSANDAVALQIAELLDQHFLRHTRNGL